MQKYFVTFLQGYPFFYFKIIHSRLVLFQKHIYLKKLHKIERPLTVRGSGEVKALADSKTASFFSGVLPILTVPQRPRKKVYILAKKVNTEGKI